MAEVVNIPGNLYDKYGTSNPLARLLMQGFLRSFDNMVDRTDAKQTYEVGCGEGHLSCRLLSRGFDARGSDLEPVAVDRANQYASVLGYNNRFAVRNIYDLTPADAAAELVICCEVLEHLPDPHEALRILSRLANPFLLVSVPREPLWRLLNVARGAYLSAFGNTPGHIQHWTPRQFTDLLRRHLEIMEVRKPLPWTMILCRTR